MTAKVERIAHQITALSAQERDELLTWLADDQLERMDAWDEEIVEDSQPGGRLTRLLLRARDDIAQGRTKPLDEVLG